jgi:hypothetical protein
MVWYPVSCALFLGRFYSCQDTAGKYDKDGRKKYHIMIPRQHIDQIESLDLEGKQVKVTLEDELWVLTKDTKLCLNCNGEMSERTPGNYICSNCGNEETIEDL